MENKYFNEKRYERKGDHVDHKFLKEVRDIVVSGFKKRGFSCPYEAIQQYEDFIHMVDIALRSFYFSADEDVESCRGTKEGGEIVKIIMDYENLDKNWFTAENGDINDTYDKLHEAAMIRSTIVPLPPDEN